MARLLRLVFATLLWSFVTPFVPKYTIDPQLLAIATKRAQQCQLPLSATSRTAAVQELERLHNTSAYDYYRSHELLAYHYFVEYREQNAHYVSSLEAAELEYIPILPLHWRKHLPGCAYKDFIQDLLAMHRLLKARDSSKPAPIRFFVSTAANMRTAWGTGMPLQVRRGDAWVAISELSQWLAVGHHERWPECPDLLRKQFRHLTEMPFVNLGDPVGGYNLFSPIDAEATVSKPYSLRKHMFAFIGTMALNGPEIACSVRNNLRQTALARNDILFVNITETYLQRHGVQAVRSALQGHLQDSVFCLITPGNSYSTSFMFNAIQSDCIPILINDWLVLPYNSLLPYQSFALRVLQADFIRNPHFVFNFIKSHIYSNKLLMESMRSSLNVFKSMLSYRAVSTQSALYTRFLALDLHHQPQPLKTAQAILPLDMLLLELKYSLQPQPRRFYNSLPCERYYACEHRRHIHSTWYNSSVGDYQYYSKVKGVNDNLLDANYINQHLAFYIKDAASSIQVTTSKGKEVLLDADSYQIQSLALAQLMNKHSIPMTSSHLCQHNKRLVGMTKMVFFMQCVRLLWPLTPGQFRPVDRIEHRNTTKGVDAQAIDTAVSIPADGGKLPAWKGAADKGVTKEEYEYVRAFHNIARPAGWVLEEYPRMAAKGRHSMLIDIEG